MVSVAEAIRSTQKARSNKNIFRESEITVLLYTVTIRENMALACAHIVCGVDS